MGRMHRSFRNRNTTRRVFPFLWRRNNLHQRRRNPKATRRSREGEKSGEEPTPLSNSISSAPPKKRRKKFVDGHPDVARDKGLKKYAWPAPFVNQANYKEDLNCKLAELASTSRPPKSLCDKVGINLAVNRLGAITTQTIYPGTQILMVYRLGMGTQMKIWDPVHTMAKKNR